MPKEPELQNYYLLKGVIKEKQTIELKVLSTNGVDWKFEMVMWKLYQIMASDDECDHDIVESFLYHTVESILVVLSVFMYLDERYYPVTKIDRLNPQDTLLDEVQASVQIAMNGNVGLELSSLRLREHFHLASATADR